MIMEEKFYKYFNLDKECCLVKKSAKELLLLCLWEFAKNSSNKIDYKQLELELFPDEFERKLFHLAGYWGTDLEYALINKLVALKVDTLLVCDCKETEGTKYTAISEKIYEWLKAEYNYTFIWED